MLSYKERAKLARTVCAKQLFELMDHKKTNLAVSADVTDAKDLLEIADMLGPLICVLKTHIDIVENFTPDLILALTQLAQKHRFLLFEDRKFADIGHTVKQQYTGGLYQIANWADIVNAHTVPGPMLIQALSHAGLSKNRGLLLIAEMSSNGHFINEHYLHHTVHLANRFDNFVMGFIAQKPPVDYPHFVTMTPGINLNPTPDALGQKYRTPTEAIIEDGTDIIIVGRGILEAKNLFMEASCYREISWQAYLERSVLSVSKKSEFIDDWTHPEHSKTDKIPAN